MMITDFLKLMDLTKLSLKWWAVFSIVGLSVLFAPDDYAAIFGFTETRDELRPYVGPFTLVSIAFLPVSGAAHLWERRQRYKAIIKRKSENEAKAISYLNKLSIEEAAILAACSYNNQQTIMLSVISAHANSLVSKGLLLRVNGAGDFREWPYTVPEFVWDPPAVGA